MAKKVKKTQVLRHAIQIIMFFIMPGLYSMTFSEVKTVYKMIIEGNFNFIQAFPSLIEFTAVMLITILMGRWFCGWVCTFGAYNDFVYAISKKIFKGKFKINEEVDSILKYTKYVVLLFIIIISWTLGSNILQSTSPWDVFGQMSDISGIFNNLLIGLVLLILITIGAAFIERFFCRYLCPLGAIFSIISKIGIVKINKPKTDCGKCRACTMNCSMGLKLYKVDGTKGGNCINCLKCTEICPRGNANINILGQDINKNLAGSVALVAMIGTYGLSNFSADALTKAGVISSGSSNEVSQGSVSNSPVQYKDGTYTGSGHGFGGTTTVSVTIAGGKITDITTLSNSDTRNYYDRAFGNISKGIISKQTTEVDTVSGATDSANGIINAVKDALNQASTTVSRSNSTSSTGSQKSEATDKTESTASNSNTKNTENTTEAVDTSNNNDYKDGTYTGSGAGYRGGTTKISVTVSDGKITGIKTISDQDTPKFYQRAEGTIMSSIISKQSTSVDTVSGATYSSKGIISAVTDALSQAK